MSDSIKNEKNNIEPEETENSSQDDVEFEADTENGESSFNLKTNLDNLRKRLKKAEAEKNEYLLGWQRTKADYINSRKQDEETNRTAIKYAEASLVSELVPVLDSFDMAFSNKKMIESLPAEWKKGMEQIYNQFYGILKAHNLEIINPEGEIFDPRVAEAVGMVDVSDEKDDHKVVSVFQKGYKLHDKVLRPAKVQVGKYSDMQKT